MSRESKVYHFPTCIPGVATSRHKQAGGDVADRGGAEKDVHSAWSCPVSPRRGNTQRAEWVQRLVLLAGVVLSTPFRPSSRVSFFWGHAAPWHSSWVGDFLLGDHDFGINISTILCSKPRVWNAFSHDNKLIKWWHKISLDIWSLHEVFGFFRLYQLQLQIQIEITYWQL